MIKNIVLFICIIGQLILIYEIGTYILTHENIGFLILCYIVLEIVLNVLGEDSLIKFFGRVLNEKK